LADFLSRARTHRVFVLPVFNELPFAGGYRDFIPKSIPWTDFGGTENQHKFTVEGVAATRRFWQDFVEALVLARAPMDALWGYDLMGEWYVSYDATPLNATSGTIKTANGSTYDLGDPASRTALYNDNLTFYANTMREAIRSVHPDALVVLGLPPNNGLNPPGFAALAASALDFVDLHGSPDGYYTSVPQLLTAWEFNGDIRKPIVMGEFDAWRSVFPSTGEAAVGMPQWQAQACAEGFSGWLFWSWDNENSEAWSALSGGGEINQALAPVNRPDPCAQ
jgi:hypothetical protein